MAKAIDPILMVERILTEHGPLHEDDIEQRLRDSGVADPDSLLEDSLDEIECPARQLVDDQWVWLPTLLAGRVFTHRLSEDEIAHDVLTVTPDLDPITALCEHEQFRRLADGSAVQIVLAGFDEALLDERDIPLEVIDPLGVLLLEPGTLEQLGVAQGDLVGLRLTERGLVVERVTAVLHDPAVGERLAATLGAEEPVYFDAAAWTVCVEDPALFTEPQPPLCEIADGYGLARRGEWLAPGGFDYDLWEFERGCERLAVRHDLDADDAFVLYTLVNVYDQMSTLLIASADTDEPLEDAVSAAGEAADEPPEELVSAAGAETPAADAFADLVGELGGALADPLLAELLLTETVGTGDEGAAAMGLFADVLEPKVPRAARVACRWLRAVALERMGNIDEAERELLAAESMDPDWPLPLFDLARFASDRGDVERGLALLRRAGAPPDHLLVELLERHRADPRRDLGRNELCWCGSGRKYKKCHLGHEQLPLAERVGWLYAKAVQHALFSGWNDVLTEVGLERCRYADVDDPDALTSALTDPLVLDAVLFEGGAFEEFVEVRGSLLPDDERLLAEQWLLVDRSVFEVEQVRRGQGVTVRDVRTGDTHEVRERMASRQLKTGQLLCARVAPAGDTTQFVGVVEPVALHERDPLIDLLDAGPDPVELVAQLSRRFAPPVLANTEGDPLAICEATMRVGAPDVIAAALDDTYDRVGGQEPRWLEHVNRHGMPQIRAMLVLEGDMLRVETNSERRMDRVLATVRRLDPTMTVLNDARRPVRGMSEVAELAKQMPLDDGDTLDPDGPEVAAALDEFILEYETKWLDEPIPALDGHTPRQAADDPTRRGDLVKLLDTFPAGDAARGGMDADRLRAALGLR